MQTPIRDAAIEKSKVLYQHQDSDVKIAKPTASLHEKYEHMLNNGSMEQQYRGRIIARIEDDAVSGS